MAYSVTNPPHLITNAPFNPDLGGKVWFYTSTDAVATVRVSGYFTDGYERGMRKGDLVIVLDNDASPITGSLCWVTEATTSTVDLSDGVTITGTDTD